MTILHDNSEISDGSRPVYADSEAPAERFLPKRNFFQTEEIKFYILHTRRILKCGREDSDAFGGL